MNIEIKRTGLRYPTLKFPKAEFKEFEPRLKFKRRGFKLIGSN